MDDEDHHEKDTPAGQRTDAPTNALLIEQESDSNRTDNLREPVDEVVERACTDIEERPVVIVELCPHPRHVRSARNTTLCRIRNKGEDALTVSVEPIASEKHREKKDDVRVVSERDPEAENLSLPGGIFGLGDMRAVRAYHPRWRHHEHRDEDTDTCENEEANLQ